jgi:glyoxylase-like metal-dependent hydrolase (beta-lactamase superfamily II)/DNA-directed RNA polymerase subunit RPC12/RpoP
MSAFICVTCGTQFAESENPPARCDICDEYRQYVGPRGQEWIDFPSLKKYYRNAWRRHLPDLYSFETMPAFGIGQRAFLVRTPAGNILWDCLALVDDATVDIINALGGLAGVAISHPHYYTTMVEWAAVFGVKVHIHADDAEWIMRKDPSQELMVGDTKELLPGLTVVRIGGHYPGGTVLHWDRGPGLLLCGDILQVTPDRKFISVLRSYPNMLPVSGPAMERIEKTLAPFQYDAVYGAFTGREIVSGGKDAVAVSIKRYLDAIRGDGSAELL